MNEEPFKLENLQSDFSGMTDEEIYEEGEKRYLQTFISNGRRSGAIESHDGQSVVFFADRFSHAFRTSFDRARTEFSKAKIAVDRIERLEWIKPMIEGRVPNTECWEVPLRVPEEGTRPFPGKRMYLSWDHQYVVWLEPLRNGGFKFSTAYANVAHKKIRDYLTRANKIWSHPEKK